MILFAQQRVNDSTAWLQIIFESPYSIPIVLFFIGGIIGLTAILTGTVLSWRKQSMKHRERLAMIDRGMHPDAPEGQTDPIAAAAAKQDAATYSPMY